MGMSRARKQEEVKQLEGLFADGELIVLTHYSGLSVAQMTDLRAKVREQEACFKVTKNTLAKIAIKGTRFEGVADLFAGPTGMAMSKDPVAAARAVYNFAKDNKKLIILGGALGDKILDKDAVETLAKLPSLEEIRSKFVGILQAPASKLARVTQAPAQNMVGVTKAYAEKGE